MRQLPPLLEKRLRFLLNAEKHQLIYCHPDIIDYRISVSTAIHLFGFVVPLPDAVWYVKCATNKDKLIVSDWKEI